MPSKAPKIYEELFGSVYKGDWNLLIDWILVHVNKAGINEHSPALKRVDTKIEELKRYSLLTGGR